MTENERNSAERDGTTDAGRASRTDAAWAAWQRMNADERSNCMAFVAGADPEAFTRVVEVWLASDLRARDVAQGRIQP